MLNMMPDMFERSAIAFTKAEVTRKVNERYPDLMALPAQAQMEKGLTRLSERLGRKKVHLENLVASDMPEIVGKLVEEYCSCGQPSDARAEARGQAIRAALEAHISTLGLSQVAITEFIRGQYDATVAALRLDLLIFLSANTLAFGAVLGATFLRRERRHAVIVPAALMVVSTVISAAIYIIGTDWFYAILFRDYVGLWYVAGLLFVFGFLVDIVINKARLTLKILSNLPAGLHVPVC